MTPPIMMDDSVEDDDSFTNPLRRLTVLYYGMGHMLNDITAACWFTYLLLFLTDIGLSPRDAAAVMLSGQTADAFATIFVGELIDRFGHFKIWHAAGSVLVAVSFSSVFGGCMPCRILATSSLTVETISYCVFAAIFNVGWAATQVSHMSMVNCITLNSTIRVVLTSCRNAFTMVANLSLYAIALIVFGVSSSKTHADLENQYRWIAYSSIFIGCCFVGIFLLGTKEPRLKLDVQGNRHTRISWVYWFKKTLYYQVALVYVLTRLVINVSQAYLAFYVIDELQMAQSAKALVPAIIYICSFIVSIILQEMAWTGQRLKAFYSAGGIIWIICGAAILVLPRSMSSFMYVISICMGIANALMMVTGISMQNVLIGEDLNGCAFVCGTLSFLDKMSCGLALYVLQSYQSSSPTFLDNCSTSSACISVTRYGLGLVPAFCSLVGVVVTYTMELHTQYSKPLMEPLLE
ncbi:major facilitator superfamily domain-containing protein 12-like isoform X2 [Mangifera indica]|uniref:major facilitator superfamily domain-containing protein 12-like isoform X2 n=1 Tax=Mangifera indica TaxID=29780 RepID=UPI001CFAEFC9|nr:major facilitator superfamily domain-containing protein 12-like isoform X2 [Mangifera indica]